MNQQYFEQSEKYLLDQMSPQERTAFEQEITVNKELEQEFELAKAILGSAALNAKNKIKLELNEIHEKHYSNRDKSKPVKNKKLKLWVAIRNIAAILILGLIIFIITKPSTSTPQEIFAKHYSSPELEITYRGKNDIQIIQDLSKSYGKGQFATYLALVSNQDSIIQARPILKLAKAIAYLETNQLSSSIDLLEDLTSNPLYKDQAEWYLALAYLNEGKISPAKQKLEQISKGNNKFKADAITIINDL